MIHCVSVGMASSAKKEFKELRREAERQGWRVVLLKGGHWRFYAPGGKGIVHAGGTPSDHKSLANTVADLRRYGFRWKGR